jgi:site-specific recombinase
MIARITRSQLAAAIGNLGMVLPAALAVDGLSRLVRGKPFLDAHAAHHVIESLHPTHGAMIFYAALTGVFLWVASIGAGWLENWVVFSRLPEGIAASPRLQRLLGADRARRLAAAVEHGAAGVGGNVTLGALLGFAPGIGKFLGLPIEARHVTLSTGSLALAGCALGATHLDATFAGACAGILVILILNFGVSFALALALALRARDASHREKVSLALAVLAEVRRAPLSFVIPPKGPSTDLETSH